MKKAIILFLTFVLVLSCFAGCNRENVYSAEVPPVEGDNEGSNGESLPSEKDETNSGLYMYYMGEGDFSEENLKAAIDVYCEDYIPLPVAKGGSIYYDCGFDIKSGGISRLSPVDEEDVYGEMDAYIDLYLPFTAEGGVFSFSADWWYGNDRRVQENPVWSYLVRVVDTEDKTHYYYIRLEHTDYEFKLIGNSDVTYEGADGKIAPLSLNLRHKYDCGNGLYLWLETGGADEFFRDEELFSETEIPSLFATDGVEAILPVPAMITEISIIQPEDITTDDVDYGKDFNGKLSDLPEGTYYVIVTIDNSGNCEPSPDSRQHGFIYEDIFLLENEYCGLTPAAPALDFNDLNEMRAYFTSDDIPQIDGYTAFNSLAKKLAAGESEFLLPYINGQDIPFRNKDGFSNITVFPAELYDRPWVWYDCVYEDTDYAVKFMYLTEDEAEISEGLSPTEFAFAHISVNIPKEDNYEKYPAYERIYECDFQLKDEVVRAICYEMADEKTTLSFFCDDLLVMITAKDRDIAENLSGFNLA